MELHEESNRNELARLASLGYQEIVNGFSEWMDEQRQLRDQLAQMDVMKAERLARVALIEDEELESNIHYDVVEDSLAVFWQKHHQRLTLFKKEDAKRQMWVDKDDTLRNIWRKLFGVIVRETRTTSTLSMK